MEAWLEENPHAGPIANSPDELRSQLRARQATEPLPLPGEPYEVYDSIVAEVHRIREHLARKSENQSMVLKEKPRAGTEELPQGNTKGKN